MPAANTTMAMHNTQNTCCCPHQLQHSLTKPPGYFYAEAVHNFKCNAAVLHPWGGPLLHLLVATLPPLLLLRMWHTPLVAFALLPFYASGTPPLQPLLLALAPPCWCAAPQHHLYKHLLLARLHLPHMHDCICCCACSCA
jgi:hypothetical protein